jgi:hypothetical protein
MDRCHGAVRIDAAEGLAFLATSAVVIAALIATLVGTQRQIEQDYRAAAADLRGSAGEVESLAAASGLPAATSLYPEEHQAVPGTGMPPVLADGER